MKRRDPELLLQSSPFQKQRLTLPRLMWEVTGALLLVLVVGVAYFGLGALLVVLAAVVGSVVAEWTFARARPRVAALRDGSALLTGLILGLILPPGLPLWMAFVGGVVAIGMGKVVWGGLGVNLFNPALVGRAFLQASFPTAMTTWVPHGSPLIAVRGQNLAFPFMTGEVDAVTTATPLAQMKFGHVATSEVSLLLGQTAGSVGETSALLLLIIGVVLALRRVFDWRVPVAILTSVLLWSGLFWVISPAAYPSPLFMVLSGGLLFGAVFMATDPVTSPMAPRGAWIFGAGIGFLVVIIRLFGGLPEGVMYAILLMNAVTPLLDRRMQPRIFGRSRKGASASGGLAAGTVSAGTAVVGTAPAGAAPSRSRGTSS